MRGTKEKEYSHLSARRRRAINKHRVKIQTENTGENGTQTIVIQKTSNISSGEKKLKWSMDLSHQKMHAPHHPGFQFKNSRIENSGTTKTFRSVNHKQLREREMDPHGKGDGTTPPHKDYK